MCMPYTISKVFFKTACIHFVGLLFIVSNHFSCKFMHFFFIVFIIAIVLLHFSQCVWLLTDPRIFCFENNDFLLMAKHTDSEECLVGCRTNNDNNNSFFNSYLCILFECFRRSITYAIYFLLFPFWFRFICSRFPNIYGNAMVSCPSSYTNNFKVHVYFSSKNPNTQQHSAPAIEKFITKL